MVSENFRKTTENLDPTFISLIIIRLCRACSKSLYRGFSPSCTSSKNRSLFKGARLVSKSRLSEVDCLLKLSFLLLFRRLSTPPMKQCVGYAMPIVLISFIWVYFCCSFELKRSTNCRLELVECLNTEPGANFAHIPSQATEPQTTHLQS